MLFLSLMLLKEILLVLPFWIQLTCAFPVCVLNTSPFARYISAANAVCRNTDSFNKGFTLHTHFN
jgi:hypothetical protein